MVRERTETIGGFVAGTVEGSHFAECLRELLLSRWSSSRSLGGGRMAAVGETLKKIRPALVEIPIDLKLEHADRGMLAEMVKLFG